VLREPRRLGATALLMLAIFLTWDAVGRASGIWWPDAAHTLGPALVGGLVPVEELLFICGTTYALLILWRVAALLQARRGRAGGR
jgi:lycopene cyclase domain-containing protein